MTLARCSWMHSPAGSDAANPSTQTWTTLHGVFIKQKLSLWRKLHVVRTAIGNITQTGCTERLWNLSFHPTRTRYLQCAYQAPELSNWTEQFPLSFQWLERFVCILYVQKYPNELYLPFHWLSSTRLDWRHKLVAPLTRLSAVTTTESLCMSWHNDGSFWTGTGLFTRCLTRHLETHAFLLYTSPGWLEKFSFWRSFDCV